MIEPTEADIGRAVNYRPAWMRYRNLPGERGVITSFNEFGVFVRYGTAAQSQSTRREDLEWEQTVGNQLRSDENVGGRSTGRPADYRCPTLDELDP